MKQAKLPNPLATFEEKKSNAYGLQVAKLISHEWFNGTILTSGNGCEYLNRQLYIRNMRLFVRGESDLGYYKNFLGVDGEPDWTNLDFSQANWAEKYSCLVSNRISDDYYNINIKSADPRTVLSQGKRREELEMYMNTVDFQKKVKEQLGVDIAPKEEVPTDQEGLDLHMQLKERPQIEIIEQILIKNILEINDWDYIEKQKNQDLTNVGMAIARVYIDPQDGIKVEQVNPEFYVHSFVERNDFSDKYYEGYIDSKTLSEIKRESNFSDKDLRKIAESYMKVKGAWNGLSYQDVYNCALDQLLDYKIDILRFAWKTSKTIKYKIKTKDGKSIKAQKRSEDFNGDKKIHKDFKEVGNTFDTWLEGNYIVGTEYLYSYKECENLYDDVMNKAQSPFITIAYDIYENRLKSFLNNIEVPVRQLQKIHLLIQRLMGQLRPDIVEIDLDMLAELDDGKGGSKKEVWETALRLLNVKGVAFRKRVNMGEDGIKDQTAVNVHSPQQGAALGTLLNMFAHYTEQIRELTGINPYRDGTMSQKSLVGVAELGNLASNTVTKHIVDAAIQMKKKVAEAISSRLHLVYSYKESHKLRKMYDNIIGKEMAVKLEVMKDRHLHEFGFVVDMKPKEEEKREFAEALQMAIQEGSIDVEIAEQAKHIAESDKELAIRFLLYERKKLMKQRQEEQMMLNQNKSENDAMAAQAKTQADAQAYQHKRQVDLQYESQLAQIRVQEKAAIMQLEAPLKDKEFEQDVYLKKIDEFGQWNKEKFKEDRKDQRTEKQASQQSKMVEQRNKDGEAIDFENEGFDNLL